MIQARKNYIWNIIGTSLNSFISLFFLVFVTRINGIDDAGVFSFAYTISFVIQTISLFGGRIYLVSDTRNEFSYSTYYTSKYITSLLAILAAIIFCVANEYDSIKFALIILFTFTRCIESFADAIYGIFQKNDRLDYVGISLFIKSITGLFVFVGIDFIFKNIILASISVLVVNIILHLFYDMILIKKFWNPTYKFENIFSLLNKTKYLFLFNTITMIIVNVPRIIADNTLEKSEIGIFGILMMIPTIMTMIGQFLVQPVVLTMSTHVSKKDDKSVNRTIKKLITIILAFTLVCIFGAIFLGPPILHLLYGLDFEQYRVHMVVMIIGGCFNTVTYVFSTLLTIMRKTKIQLVLYSITLILSLILTYFLIGKIGTIGAYIAYCGTMIIQFGLFIMYTFLGKKTNQKGI